MERRVTSHTEEEEMNQRRRLLTLARKGDQKAIDLLFELYQVKVFSGDALKKKKLPSFPVIKPLGPLGKGKSKSTKKKEKGQKPTVSATKTKGASPQKLKESKKEPKPVSKLGTKDKEAKSSRSKTKKVTVDSSKKAPKKARPGIASLPTGKSKQKKLPHSARPRLAKKK